MKLEGLKPFKIENLLGISEPTIRSIQKKKYLNTVELNKAKRSGRPPEISQWDQNWLVRQTKNEQGTCVKDYVY